MDDPVRPDDGDIIARLQAENERLHADLRAAREHVLHLETDIRSRIGRDLHDGPIQQIAAAGLHINYLRRVLERAPHLLPSAIGELDDQLAQAMHSLRTVLLELRPAGIEEHGLYWILQEYARKFPAGNDVQVILDAPSDLPRLPLDHEIAVFIIISEAMMNIRKHSVAKTATITIRVVDHALRVVVRDDGHGFDVTQESAKQGSSYGLTTMRERAERIGGTVEITSALGSGTTVTICVPIGASSSISERP